MNIRSFDARIGFLFDACDERTFYLRVSFLDEYPKAREGWVEEVFMLV